MSIVDLGTALHHSHRLAGLPPSTYPPPLGERTIQSGWTHSHLDSHTMGDHELEILEIPDIPCHVWEDEPLSTYGNLVGSGRQSSGRSHE